MEKLGSLKAETSPWFTSKTWFEKKKRRSSLYDFAPVVMFSLRIFYWLIDSEIKLSSSPYKLIKYILLLRKAICNLQTKRENTAISAGCVVKTASPKPLRLISKRTGIRCNSFMTKTTSSLNISNTYPKEMTISTKSSKQDSGLRSPP